MRFRKRDRLVCLLISSPVQELPLALIIVRPVARFRRVK